ncbi:hypothetical protein BS78_10G056100 [Paspalum vaginatum]|nr:hypothetical protein BS78_10G056100 [Paspalum vaginatum]
MGDPFPADGAFVRLRHRVRDDTYLCADEDGEGVSLRPLGRAASPLNTVWRVHRATPSGCAESCVLLRGAAYGRYLAISPFPSPPGHSGRPAIQRDYGNRELTAVAWRAVKEAGYVRLAYDFNRSLRANGKYRFWNTGVTVDSVWPFPSRMMHWTVEIIPPRPAPPALPLPTHQTNQGGWTGLFRRRTGPVADGLRRILYVRANGEGDFNENHDDWRAFIFNGRSVFNLRTEVGLRQPDGDVSGITICVRPGLCGRLTPLVTDLPQNEDVMDIVVLINGSPAAERLAYPDV